jgi:hypothetical protein
MKKQITELRIRIDGLAQLVKSLLNQGVFLIDGETIPPNMTTEEVAKALREHDGAIISKVKYEEVKPSFPNFMLSSCYQSLLLSKAWLGKVLAELGSESPYQNDGARKTVGDIEPAADVHPEIVGESDKTYIEKIDWLREEIKGIVKETEGIYYMDDLVTLRKVGKGYYHAVNAIRHLSEARFHLGFELQRIKESK